MPSMGSPQAAHDERWRSEVARHCGGPATSDQSDLAATVAAGQGHTLCLRPADGAALSCGSSYGTDLHLLGQGQASGPPVRVPAPVAGLDGVAVREVAAGQGHTLLLGACGGVWSCGTGHFGRLGHGDAAKLATPRRISGLEQVRAVQVAAGGSHSLVLSAAGHVYSFGSGADGQLGHGDAADQPRPVRVAALLETRVRQLSAGERHSLATDEAGALYAWGDSAGGRLGLGAATDGAQLVPARVALPAFVRIRQASAGYGHSLAVAYDGALYSFGNGRFGQLGHGDEEALYSPTAVAALAGTPVRAAAAGGIHSAVLTEAGGVHTFGNNESGQLGHDDAATRLEPMAVAALANVKVVEVVAGDGHTVVRLASGELRAFGWNGHGQLGTGRASDSFVPAEVALPEPCGPPVEAR